MEKISNALKKKVICAQRLELTEHILYKKLASTVSSQKNKKVLEDIAAMELKHYLFFKKYTSREVKPYRFKINMYYVLSRIIGITFGVKLMEYEEKRAQVMYSSIMKDLQDVKKILAEEEEHEAKLINLIQETRTHYIGSIVLGLNDALVELTGALAGLTLAFGKTNIIAIAGLITGIAASLSMAASEYLSTKAERGKRNPMTAAVYTGIAYITTVFILISPYLLFPNPYIDLVITLCLGLGIVFLFTFYEAVTTGEKFLHKFLEMTMISLGVASFTFLIGLAVRYFFGIEV